MKTSGPFGTIVCVAFIAMTALKSSAGDRTVTFANHGSSKIINGQTAAPVNSGENVKVALYWAPLGTKDFVQAGDAANVGVPVDGVFAGGTRAVGSGWSGEHRVLLRVRAWGGGLATYEQALQTPGVLVGQSLVFAAVTGDPEADPPIAAGSILAGGFEGFTLMTNAPLRLTCFTDKTEVCGNDWSFDEPAATGGCSETRTVITLSNVTNGTCPQVIRRTWLASDACGYTATCSQSVTVICPDCTMLEVQMACPPHPVPPGGTLVFSGTVSNAGGVPLSDVVVLNDQPSPKTLVFGPATLNPGEAATFTGQYTVRVSTGPFVDTLGATGLAPLGVVFSNFATASCAAATVVVPGDSNGDGIVSRVELSTVLSNFWPHSAAIYLTNVARTTGGQFEFSLTDVAGWNFSVLASTNLADWTVLSGTAHPVFRFSDPEATNIPARTYRLRWP